jgi:hypothetical protein
MLPTIHDDVLRRRLATRAPHSGRDELASAPQRFVNVPPVVGQRPDRNGHRSSRPVAAWTSDHQHRRNVVHPSSKAPPMQMTSVTPSSSYPPHHCPPAAPIAAGLLDAAGKLVGDARNSLQYATAGSFDQNTARMGAQLLLNGVDMLAIAFPQATSMTGRFAANAQQVVTAPTRANTEIALADAKSAVELVNALRPHAA